MYGRPQTYGFSLKKSISIANADVILKYASGYVTTTKQLSSLEIEISFTEKQIYKVHLNFKKFPRKCSWFVAAAKSSCHSSGYLTACTGIGDWNQDGKRICSFSCPTTDRILIKGTYPLYDKIVLNRVYVDV